MDIGYGLEYVFIKHKHNINWLCKFTFISYIYNIYWVYTMTPEKPSIDIILSNSH